MVYFSDDILENIVSFFYKLDVTFPHKPLFDIKTLSKLSEVNKRFYSIARDSKIWKEYYRSFGKYWKLAPNARHVGIQTYHRCSIGHYPGWNYIHLEIPTTVHKCTNINHYDKHVKVDKNVRWKDLNHYCAKVTYKEMMKQNGEWELRDKEMLEWLIHQKNHVETRIENLKSKKELYERAYMVFYKYIPLYDKLLVAKKINDGLVNGSVDLKDKKPTP